MNRFFDEDNKTIEFRLLLKDRNIEELIKDDILFASTTIAEGMMIFAGSGGGMLYTMNDWAWEYLKDNPQLLK